MRALFRISAVAALALSATALTAQAQTKTMGIVAGVDFASISGDFESPGSSSRTGFMGGLFFGIPVGGGNMMVEPEILYSMKGDKYDNSAYTGTEKLDYIEVPILFKWSSQPSGAGVYLLAGPAVNFNISCSDSGTDNIFDTTYDEKCSDIPEVDVNTVISGVVGLGYSKGRFGIEGRYDFDLGDAVTYTDPGTGTVYGGKNQVWAVMLRFTK
jgi:hypothetical protein